MKKAIACSVLCNVLLFSSALEAAIIEITDVSGVWVDTTPDFPDVTGLNSSSIRWGNPVYSNYKSGYDFNSFTPPNIPVTLGTGFALGEFVHRNYPITGTALTNAELKVSTTVNFDGVSKQIDSIFQFEHWETINHPGYGNRCANGGWDGSGINYYGCADRVTFALNESKSTSYTIGNQQYYLDVAGFFYSGKLADEFWTKEKKANHSVLAGMIKSNTIHVPEPSTLALLGLGLITLSARRMTKR